jgi:hypothetical protein
MSIFSGACLALPISAVRRGGGFDAKGFEREAACLSRSVGSLEAIRSVPGTLPGRSIFKEVFSMTITARRLLASLLAVLAVCTFKLSPSRLPGDPVPSEF